MQLEYAAKMDADEERKRKELRKMQDRQVRLAFFFLMYEVCVGGCAGERAGNGSAPDTTNQTLYCCVVCN